MKNPFQPSIQEVCAALAALDDIARPDGDNHGDPINSPTVFPYLSEDDQHRVNEAEDLLHRYTRGPGGGVDNRRVNTLTRRGFRSHLNPSQEDPYRNVGSTQTTHWLLDISDSGGSEEDLN